VGRLYKINDAGKLTLLEAAPMTLPLAIVEQPSEMVYHLRYLQSQGKFTWGESTNSLRAGVAHSFEPQRVIRGDEIEVFLMNDRTNDLHHLLLRAPDQRFDILLYDPFGKEVPKTALGEQQGNADSPPPSMKQPWAEGSPTRRANIGVQIPIGRPTPSPEPFDPFPPLRDLPDCDHDDRHLD
jgi:hypothetical protein